MEYRKLEDYQMSSMKDLLVIVRAVMHGDACEE